MKCGMLKAPESPTDHPEDDFKPPAVNGAFGGSAERRFALERDAAGDVSGQPDPVPVHNPHVGSWHHPVLVDEGAVGGSLVPDDRVPRAVYLDGGVPPGDVVEAGEGGRDQRFRRVTAEQHRGAGRDVDISGREGDAQHHAGDAALYWLEVAGDELL